MRYHIHIKEGEFCTANEHGPISDYDGFSGGYDTLEEAIAELESMGADRSEITLRKGARLWPLPSPPASGPSK